MSYLNFTFKFKITLRKIKTKIKFLVGTVNIRVIENIGIEMATRKEQFKRYLCFAFKP